MQTALGVLETTVRNGSVVLGGVDSTIDAANAMIERSYVALVLRLDWSLLQRRIASTRAG